MFRFLPGLVLVQLVTLALAWAVLGAPLPDVALRLGLPALIVAATAAFWFAQLGRLNAERELARTRLEHTEERERLRREALVETERLKLDARAESDRVRLDAERDKAAVVDAARRESRAQERRIDRRANARVALAFAGAAAAGTLMLLTPLVTVGLVTIAATGGGLGGYALRWRQTRSRTLPSPGVTVAPVRPDGAGPTVDAAAPTLVGEPGGSPRRARLLRAFALVALGLLAGGAPSPSALAQSDLVDDLLGGGEPEAPAASGRTIDTDSDAATDAGIRRRLTGIFAELEPSRGVTVEVANGIVTLGGTAASSAAAERSVAIAEAVEGVVQVVDEMDVDTNVRRRLTQTLERLRASTLDALAALPVLAVALAVVVTFWFLGRWVGRRRSVFAALAPNGFIAELLSGIVRVAVTLGGVIIALTLLDATSLIGTVLGAAGIVGLAVGFAVRDTVENYIASILLSLRTPFLAGDLVRIDDHFGTVARLTSRATVLISRDGNHIRLPNSLVFKAVIVNYSTNPTRRVAFTVGVDTEFDPLVAQSLALDTLAEVPGIVAEPRPTARVQALGDSSVTLEIAGWVDQAETDPRAMQSEAIRAVKQAFDAAGIVMPEPIYRLRLDARGPGGELMRRLGASITETGGAPDGGGEGGGEGAGRAPGERTGGAARRTGAAAAEPLGSARAAAQARDVSVDTSVADTVARERERGADEDLLHAGVPRE